MSPALLNFVGILASREPAAFAAEAARLGSFDRTATNEATIALRLTDQAVRVWGAQPLPGLILATLLVLTTRALLATGIRSETPPLVNQLLTAQARERS